MPDQANLLFEIGVEELPATYVESAARALPKLLTERLKAARLTHGEVSVYATPRRIAVIITDLATRQPDLKEELKGPPARVAFDKEGKPTRAAEAFAKKIGCAVEDLQQVDTPKGKYLIGVRQEQGNATRDLLGPMLEESCAKIPFRKSMRWSDGETAFGRPVRWLVALFGDEVIDMTFADVRSGRTTYGHRFLAPAAIELRNASDYVESLKRAHVIPSSDERRKLMVERLHEACEARGVRLVEDDFLEGENLHLVEEPHIVPGGFEEKFLELPEDVIIAVAKGHQRYFSTRTSDGKLAPVYMAVAGTAENPDNVRRGNDRVMRARLADAQFFYHEDMKVPLEDRFEQTDGIVFQKRLGTVKEKVLRMEKLVDELAKQTHVSEQVAKDAREGAHLCKADLASLMVGEFPELQGEMGAVYAMGQGKTEAVADVIRNHYRPKGASDDPPEGDSAALVGLADRIDTLVGCFAIGLSPTGTSDPYALRRSCLTSLRTILARGYEVSLRDLFAASFETFSDKKLDLTKEQTIDKLMVFFRDRLRGLLADGLPTDVVDACMGSGYDDPLGTKHRAEALAGLAPEIRSKAGEVFKRATNIAKEAPDGEPKPPKQVSGEAVSHEIELFEELQRLDKQLQQAQSEADYPKAFAAIADFAPRMGSFFDNVFVMTDDLPLRENRLRLMRAISDRCSGLARFNLLA